MDDAGRSLLDLWDTTEDVLSGLRADDWARPVNALGMDVLDLAVHLTGVHYAGPARLGQAVGAARTRAAAQLLDRSAGDRVLAAWCLDMCLHTHDLGRATGRPVDLGDYPGATREACRLAVDLAPRLLVAASGPRDCTLRLRVACGLERVVHVADGRPAPARPGDAATDIDSVDVDPAALLLLLSGRRTVDELRADGAVRWSGETAESFVHSARLPA